MRITLQIAGITLLFVARLSALQSTNAVLNIDNAYYPLNANRYAWTIWIAESQSRLHDIKCVEYTLHPTFPDPVRTQCDETKAFSLSTAGWGEFSIEVKVTWHDGHQSRQTYNLDFSSDDRRISKDTALKYPLLGLNRMSFNAPEPLRWSGFHNELLLQVEHINAGAPGAFRLVVYGISHVDLPAFPKLRLPPGVKPAPARRIVVTKAATIDHLPTTVPITFSGNHYSLEVLEKDQQDRLLVAIH